ncbi:hypothetical protein N825_33135 [Skermanella stibiiresistens SB22]|uniref:DUF4239 domain-containing protein n=1 Tax=Skermanella stibiiresistens SB22 TaxID=1385369 RepID=W9H3K2_9PROT|nr:DUF4239 domain-containing protein [Skermanella stibiiresistens]EWY40775.1 hypothetical protein N825_33135 [Skermanella stibiiresistens SB22]
MDIFADLARWIAEQPLSAGGTWVVVGSALCGLVGTMISTFLIGPDERDTTLTGLKLEVLGQIFSGLLVFVLVHGAILQYDLRTLLDQEGRLLTGLHLTALRTDPDGLAATVERYARMVVERETPALARGKADLATQGAFDDLLLAFAAAPPTISPGTGQSLGELVEVRSKRLVRGIPDPLMGYAWLGVAFATVTTIVFASLVIGPSLIVQALLSTMMSLSAITIAYLAILMNHPWSGEMGIFPRTIEDVLRWG